MSESAAARDARGAELGNPRASEDSEDIVEQWFVEIETLNVPPAPEPQLDPIVEPTVPSDETPGRARARARSEARHP